MQDERSDQNIRGAQTTLLALETVAFASEELGVTQIAVRLGLTKGAVFRHLQGLVERGYLAQNPVTARYRLGVKAALIGRLAPSADDVALAAEAPMQELRDATGITAVLTTPTTHGALVVKTMLGTQRVEIGVRAGSELAFHASAQGKVMLAFANPTLLSRILRAPLSTLTPYTITDPDRLKGEIKRARSQGFAAAPEEALLGINALAAPVFNVNDELVASVALVGSIQFITREPDRKLIDDVIQVAKTISRNLGHGMIPGRGWSSAPYHTADDPPPKSHAAKRRRTTRTTVTSRSSGSRVRRTWQQQE